MNKVMKAVVLAGIAVLGLGSVSGQAVACSDNMKDGFLPKNNRYIPARRTVLDRNGNPLGGGITEAEFNGIMAAVDQIYAPIVKSMGATLKIKGDWKDGTVNAYADREDGNWNVSMFGGLARHKETTIDGFMLVVCHELGHHIGGAPKYGGDEWASNEGESDYFATLKCARRVLQKTNNLRALRALDAPDSVRIACRDSFKVDNDAALCIRTSMGGMSLARLLADLGGARTEKDMPKFETPDPSKVSRTEDGHPDAQCRLDTYYNGALCPVAFTTDVDQKDPLVGTCSQEKGAKTGFRPRCWYAPQTDNRAIRRFDPRAAVHGRFF